MELDGDLQRRLASLAAEERSPLDNLDRQRILARVREAEAVEAGRASRAASIRGMGLTAMVALAAAALLLVALSRASDRSAATQAGSLANLDKRPVERVDAVEEALRARASTVESVRVPPSSPRCATLEVPTARARRDRRGAVIDLGERARFVLSRGADGAIVEATPCSTTFALRAGGLAVHARDLAGGELVVRTDSGDVVVHGTIFSVSVDAPARPGVPPALQVSVAEGEVGVVVRGRASDGAGNLEVARLRPGEGARVEHGLDARGRLVAASRRFDARDEVEPLAALVASARHGRPAPAPASVSVPAPTPAVSATVTVHGEVLEGTVEVRSGHPLLRTPVMTPIRLEAPIEAPLEDLP